MHHQPTRLSPQGFLTPPAPTRKNFKPARPDPQEFQTRPTRPAYSKTCPNPALPVRVPYPSGRVGSGCSTLQGTMVELVSGNIVSSVDANSYHRSWTSPSKSKTTKQHVI